MSPPSHAAAAVSSSAVPPGFFIKSVSTLDMVMVPMVPVAISIVFSSWIFTPVSNGFTVSRTPAAHPSLAFFSNSSSMQEAFLRLSKPILIPVFWGELFGIFFVSVRLFSVRHLLTHRAKMVWLSHTGNKLSLWLEPFLPRLTFRNASGSGHVERPLFASTWPRPPSLSMVPKSPHHRFNFSTSNALIIVSYSSLGQLVILSVTGLSVGPNSNLKQSQVSH